MEDLMEQVLSVQKNLDKSLSPEKHYHNAPWEYTSKKIKEGLINSSFFVEKYKMRRYF